MSTMTEKPPDPPPIPPSKTCFETDTGITTRKTSLQDILLPNVDYQPLYDAITRTHRLTILHDLFVRTFILMKYDTSQQDPIIDEEFSRMAFRTIALDAKAGRKPQGDNAKLLNELMTFYANEFASLVPTGKLDASCLSIS